jgi:hypothetical protein
MAFYSTEATRRAQNIKMMADMLSTYLDEKSEERKLYATTPDTKLYEYWDPQTQSYRRGTRDVASRYAVKAPEEPKLYEYWDETSGTMKRGTRDVALQHPSKAPEVPDAPMPGELRDYVRGKETITEQYINGEWKQFSTGQRWEGEDGDKLYNVTITAPDGSEEKSLKTEEQMLAGIQTKPEDKDKYFNVTITNPDKSTTEKRYTGAQLIAGITTQAAPTPLPYGQEYASWIMNNMPDDLSEPKAKKLADISHYLKGLDPKNPMTKDLADKSFETAKEIMDVDIKVGERRDTKTAAGTTLIEEWDGKKWVKVEEAPTFKPDKITPGKIETFWKNGEPRTTIWKDGVRVWQDSGEPATNEELAKYTQKKADKPKVSTTEIWYDKISGDAITIEVRGDGRYYAGTDDKITGVELQTLTKAKPEGKKASTYRTAWDKNTGERIDIEIKQDNIEYNMATDNPITPGEKMNMTMTKPEDKLTKRWKDAANAIKILNHAENYGEDEARELYGDEAVDEHFPDGFPTSKEEIDARRKAREEKIKNAAKSIITTTKSLSQDERNKYFRMIESKEKPKDKTRINLMEADAKIIRATFLQRRPNSEVSVYPSIQEFFDVTNAQLAALNKRNPQNPPLPLLSSLDQAKEFIKKTFSEYQSGEGNAIIYIHSDPLPLRSFGMIDQYIAEAVLSGLEG